MKYIVEITTEKDVREICKWKYEPPYDVYDYLEYEDLEEQGWAIANNEIRNREFFSVYNKDDLIAIFRLKEQNENTVLGLSLKPELCGQGFGKNLMEIILKKYEEKYNGKRLILHVRDFNKRAIKLYTNSGFTKIGEKEEIINGNLSKMIIMEYKGI